MKTKQQMLEDREVKRLSEELGRLSEHEEQNKKRMLEIAHVLVNHYLHHNQDPQWLANEKRNDEVEKSKKERS